MSIIRYTQKNLSTTYDCKSDETESDETGDGKRSPEMQ